MSSGGYRPITENPEHAIGGCWVPNCKNSGAFSFRIGDYDFFCCQAHGNTRYAKAVSKQKEERDK